MLCSAPATVDIKAVGLGRIEQSIQNAGVDDRLAQFVSKNRLSPWVQAFQGGIFTQVVRLISYFFAGMVVLVFTLVPIDKTSEYLKKQKRRVKEEELSRRSKEEYERLNIELEGILPMVSSHLKPHSGLSLDHRQYVIET